MPSITSNLTTFTNFKAGNMSVGAAANWYWTTPSNAQTDDNNYTRFEWHDPNQLPTFAVGQSDVLDARQIVTTVPSGATIDGIQVTIRAFNSLNGTFDINDTVNLLKALLVLVPLLLTTPPVNSPVFSSNLQLCFRSKSELSPINICPTELSIGKVVLKSLPTPKSPPPF